MIFQKAMQWQLTPESCPDGESDHSRQEGRRVHLHYLPNLLPAHLAEIFLLLPPSPTTTSPFPSPAPSPCPSVPPCPARGQYPPHPLPRVWCLPGGGIRSSGSIRSSRRAVGAVGVGKKLELQDQKATWATRLCSHLKAVCKKQVALLHEHPANLDVGSAFSSFRIP